MIEVPHTGTLKSVSVARWYGNLKLRSKMLLPLLVAASVILSLDALGGIAVSSTASNAQKLYQQSAQPLDALGHIRDSEGDSRVAVREFVLAANAAQRTSVKQAVADADTALDDAVAIYRSAKGSSLTASRLSLLTTFTSAVHQWRGIRDSQVFPTAIRSGAAAAALVIASRLATVDDQFAAAMDRIDTAEGADAARLAATAASTASSARRNLIALGLLGFLISLGIGMLAVRAVTRPLATIGRGLAAMATGNLTFSVAINTRDELGQMATAFTEARDATRDTVTALATSADALRGTSHNLVAISHEIATSADQANALANDVANSASHASVDVRSVATGAEQMGASISEIARNSSDAASVATNAVIAAQAAATMMDRLAAASTSIAAVTKTISAVAAQTNLLALNATIEAARAGDAGKGFAVVASEVKELAQETARASEDITNRVGAISTETDTAIGAIGEISDIINQINNFQSTIAAAVEEQSATTNEMNRGVAEAAGRTSTIAENIAQVAERTAATRSSVGGAEDAAATLSQMSDELSAVVARFTT